MFKKTAAVLLAVMFAACIFQNVFAFEIYENPEDPGSMSGILSAMTEADPTSVLFPNAVEAAASLRPLLRAGGGVSSLLPDLSGGKAPDSLIPARTKNDHKEYTITRVWDYDTGRTLGRCYAPSDDQINTRFMTDLTGEGECSIACPFQLIMQAVNPSGTRSMVYRSAMRYLYPPDPDHYFVEGQRYGLNMNTFVGYPMEMMMYPRTANEYADLLAVSYACGEDIYRMDMNYVTDSEDPFLAQKSREQKDYMNLLNPMGFLFQVTCDGVLTTYAEGSYYLDSRDGPLVMKIVVCTSIIHLVETDLYTNAVIDFAETVVPYVYSCIASEAESEEAFADFDLFVANSRATDEFALVTMKESQLLNEIISGVPVTYDEDEIMESLGYEDGSFYEDQFSDYILDQNDFTTSDGRSFKVPTSFDYVYEKDDGTIYVTNGTEQPPGSTRLYAN